MPPSFPIPLGLIAFLFGTVFGSFGNVLVHRLPQGQGIGGRSRCPNCGRILPLQEIIPVISFFVLGGRCRGCRRPISWQYPLVEIVSGLLFLWSIAKYSPSLELAMFFALCLWLLLLIAVADIRYGAIPDSLNVPFLLFSGIFGFLTGPSPLLAAALCAGFFALQWILSWGRWVGSGDILLGGGVGLLLGDWRLALLALLIAYIVGAVVAALLLALEHKTLKSTVPFGPFLAIGTVSALLMGEKIVEFVRVI